jgi:uncharacterized repeat protein (TIGR01451 family)
MKKEIIGFIVSLTLIRILFSEIIITNTARYEYGSPTITNSDDCYIIIKEPSIKVEKSISIQLGGAGSEPVPGSTIIYTLVYDNDGDGRALNVKIEDMLPENVTYVVDSAEVSNIPHAGSVTVEYQDFEGTWHDATWDNENPEGVRGVRWLFSLSLEPTDGDSVDTGEDNVPADDPDAGTVQYKVTIN